MVFVGIFPILQLFAIFRFGLLHIAPRKVYLRHRFQTIPDLEQVKHILLDDKPPPIPILRKEYNSGNGYRQGLSG